MKYPSYKTRRPVAASLCDQRRPARSSPSSWPSSRLCLLCRRRGDQRTLWPARRRLQDSITLSAPRVAVHRGTPACSAAGGRGSSPAAARPHPPPPSRLSAQISRAGIAAKGAAHCQLERSSPLPGVAQGGAERAARHWPHPHLVRLLELGDSRPRAHRAHAVELRRLHRFAGRPPRVWRGCRCAAQLQSHCCWCGLRLLEVGVPANLWTRAKN